MALTSVASMAIVLASCDVYWFIVSAIIANFLKLINLSGPKVNFLLVISMNSYQLGQILDEINKIKYKLNLFLWKSLKLSGIHLP